MLGASSSQTKFESGAVRGPGVAGQKNFPARFGLISPVGLRRIAETYGEGSGKYGDYNWEKGIPTKSLMDHAMAHINQYNLGDRSEDHLAHAAWNLIAIMHNEELLPEMCDLKRRVQ